MPLALAFKPK